MTASHQSVAKRLTEREAAEYLTVRPGTLSVWRVRRRGPRYLKIGRCIRYEQLDLDEFLSRAAVEPSQGVEI